MPDRGAPDSDHELAPLSKHSDDEEKHRLSDDLETANGREDAGLLPQAEQEEQPPPKSSSFTSGLVWMVVNTLATIGIVNTLPLSQPSPAYLPPTGI